MSVNFSETLNPKQLMAKWLKDKFDLTHFVTLASNDPMPTTTTMRQRLKEWDARVNRALYGPKWASHRDELIWYFAFLEKPGVNPHWHLLLRHVGRVGSDLAMEHQKFPPKADIAWREVMPSGTVDVQLIARHDFRTVEEYVAKELRGDIQYSSFITPDEFRRF